jgi:hypothetical protein
MEAVYLNLDKNRLITEQAKFTQTKISSHSNFDIPSNKLHTFSSHKKRAQEPSCKATKLRDSKDSPRKCYSCNSLDHLLPDCPPREKYLKERKANKYVQKNSNKKEYVSMANVIDFSPIKTILEEEESHNSASTNSQKLINTE